MSSSGVEPLPAELIGALARADAHPLDASAARGVEHVQTHISQVFLTAERVYKLRKAVRPGFLDFGTRALRDQDCLDELRLNRRLAPDVYLGVAPIFLAGGAARVGPPGEALDPRAAEHCVVMRRLPAGRDALSLLGKEELGAQHVDAVAERLARFHAQVGLGVPAPFPEAEWLERVSRPVEANLALLAGEPDAVPREAVDGLAQQARHWFAAHRASFLGRRSAGRAVDGHGDVHLAHVWFERDASAPVLIDCLEFSEALRRIDAASELAFLAMDLRHRGRPELGERLLRRYAAATDDFDLYRVVDYFMSYRAAVRAKVAAMSAAEDEIPAEQRRREAQSARRHLALARELLVSRRGARLLLLCGRVGTGKSSVAEHIADASEGVVIGSDRVRKHLAGLAATDRGGAAAGIYAREWTERVYRALLERAGPVLESGRVAVLDATFPLAALRAAAVARARSHGVPCWIVETRCAEAVALERLARREREGRDASDAGPALYAASAAGFEPVAAGEADRHIAVETDREDWSRALLAALR